MKMKLLAAITGIILVLSACTNPFFPEAKSKSEEKETPIDNLEAILSAAVHATAPATGDAPVTKATTDGVNGNNFTVSGVSWSPKHSVFQGLTEYTISVSLKAKKGYTFDGLEMAGINNRNADIKQNTGDTAVLSHTFNRTDKNKVIGIRVSTQPNLNYKHGGKLDLSGLEVTLTYDDGDELPVLYEDFYTRNMDTNPVHDSVLFRSIHDGTKIEILYGRLEPAKTDPLIVDEVVGAAVAVPVANSVAAASITVNIVNAPGNGQTVEYAISEVNNADPSTLAWQDARTLNGTTAGTAYYAYARSKENVNYTAGMYSVSALIRYWSVTFNTGGASSATPAVQYMLNGNRATKPSDPSRTTASGADTTRFRGWFLNARPTTSSTSTWNFNNTITANITLYADWGYREGETGPGLGKVFYRSDSGFTQYTSATDTTGTRCYYLEASIGNRSSGTWGAFTPGQSFTYYSIDTGTSVGTGRRNTLRIIADGHSPAAPKACADYGGGNLRDWFLPSRDELAILYSQKSLFTDWVPANYWSSSQYSVSDAYYQNFSSGDQGNSPKQTSFVPRAIRAF